jgi:hypothetical protein
MTMKILKDDALDNLLETEGYVTVPFLNEGEVQTLVSIYNANHPNGKEGLYATAHSDSYEFKKRLNDEILKQFMRAINELFYQCRPLGGSYIVKYKGEKGVLFPHQDWNIVDEDYFRSFNIWVPLVDTNEENGAISVLPKSHKLVKSFRGVNIPDPFMKINGYTWKFHKTLNMKAGEALIYDHRLLHASIINQTDKPRLAVVFGIIPEQAEMKYFYMENGIVSEYANSVDFFFEHDILKGPQGLPKIKDIDYRVSFLNEEGFDELYTGKKAVAKSEPVVATGKPSILSRVKNWLSAA